MTQKYIIDKEDLPKLIKGEALALDNGNAFSVEVNGTLTNGDVIWTLFKNVSIETVYDGDIWFRVDNSYFRCSESWWNSPYKECDKNDNNKV